MSNWGNGYEKGYRDAANKLFKTVKEVDEFMKGIGKSKSGELTVYAVASRCCGGIDAHSVECRR